ncbi:hypothetical protein ACRAWD_32150 [Caulobacter segnis]
MAAHAGRAGLGQTAKTDPARHSGQPWSQPLLTSIWTTRSQRRTAARIAATDRAAGAGGRAPSSRQPCLGLQLGPFAANSPSEDGLSARLHLYRGRR